jgi:hypothetical protein
MRIISIAISMSGVEDKKVNRITSNQVKAIKIAKNQRLDTNILGRNGQTT